jgi:hypothetical protein
MCEKRGVGRFLCGKWGHPKYKNNSKVTEGRLKAHGGGFQSNLKKASGSRCQRSENKQVARHQTIFINSAGERILIFW